jgi:hypothetical protein
MSTALESSDSLIWIHFAVLSEQPVFMRFLPLTFPTLEEAETNEQRPVASFVRIPKRNSE